MSNVIYLNRHRKPDDNDWFQPIKTYQPPKQKQWDDYTLDEQIEICLKQNWSLPAYTHYATFIRRANQEREFYKHEERLPLLPYREWVIEKLTEQYKMVKS